MNRNYKKIGIIVLGFMIAVFAFSIKSYAGSISVSSPSTVEPGKSFTVTIKGNNATGQVTLKADNATLSKSTVWVEDSTITVTATAGSEGKVTITATPTDVSDSITAQAITGSKSTSTEVKKKIETAPTQTSQNNNNSSNSSNNTTNNNKKNNTTNKTTEIKKTETKVEETKEQEEAKPQWGISSVLLTGIKDNEEKVVIELDKNFDINTYEYSCNVGADIKKIEIQKEAYEYNEFVTITGLEEDLKSGENIITLKLSKEGQQDLIYTIKINKEEIQKTEQASVEIVNEDKEQVMVSMPLWCFVLLEIVIVGATVGITLLVIKLVKDNKSNDNNKKDNGKNSNDGNDGNDDNKYEIIG